MPARDPLERRKFIPTVPTNLKQPPRPTQLVESTKDAFVLQLRQFFSTNELWIEKRDELPTVEKYSINFGENLDPYPTFTKIVEEFPDVLERMPHIAVTATAGQNKRMTVGRPFVAHTQSPPRVVTAVAGPYAFGSSTAQIVGIQVLVLPAAVYQITVDSVTYTITVAGGIDLNGAVIALARALGEDPALSQLFRVTNTQGPSAAVFIQRRAAGVPFTVTVSPNLSATVLQSAGNVTTPDVLVFRTRAGGRVTPQVSTVQFLASRLKSTESMGALEAVTVARLFNEQALYAYARVVPVPGGQTTTFGLQLETGGPLGAAMPNEIEILSTSTPALVAALGLADSGVAAGGDSITGMSPTMTINIVGAGFTASMKGRYFVGAGASSVNNGRFLISDVLSADALVIENPSGVAQALSGSFSWFIGFRDDTTNPLRPAMNRYAASASLTVTLDIFAEDPDVRREVFDLVFNDFIFYMEQQFFTMLGRGAFDEAFPDEHYQISVHQEVQDAGEQDFPRGEDQKNRIHAGRLVVPVTINWYLDRPVLVPYGPRAGQQWTLEAADVQPDDSLPDRS